MTIKDLKRGMNCTLLCVRKDKSFEHPVQIHQVNRDNILITAIVVDGKVVSLHGISAFLIVQSPNGVPEVFQYIIPVLTRDKSGKAFYTIKLLHAVSKKYNRRKNARMPVGATINVRADSNQRTYTCVLKDISATGFALVFSRKNIPQNYKTIKTFHFLYNDYEASAALKTSLNLTGTVKRRVELEDERMLFGCQFAESKIVEKFIEDKVRIHQKTRR